MNLLGKYKARYRVATVLALLLVSFLFASFCGVPVAKGVGEPPEVWNRTYSSDLINYYGQDVAITGNDIYWVGYIAAVNGIAFIRKY
ncbi:MAG: hypothetical protein LUQ65_12260, partial [Candidatus Helarchaeota archaeon]|nr:hypothetical protein [Candidatus Helarchaeota archaeon]